MTRIHWNPLNYKGRLGDQGELPCGRHWTPIMALLLSILPLLDYTP